MNFLEDTLIIIVIYKMTPAKSSTYQSLVKCDGISNASLLLYDNSPESQAYPEFENLKIFYFHDSNNGGVSRAYNYGSRLAEKLNKKWLLLFDQDDEFDPSTLKIYYDALNQFPEEKLFAPIVKDERSIISPFKMRFGGGVRLKKIEPGFIKLNEYFLINSGLFISIDAFNSCGGFDERFPLDFSDIVFIKNLRKNFKRIVLLPKEINHKLSSENSTSLETSIFRFRIYLDSSVQYSKVYCEGAILYRSFYRAIILSFKFKTFRFIKIFIAKSSHQLGWS